MPSLADIRKSLRSIKSTQKITGAMKLVAASKLRRAQSAILAARPYAVEVGGLLRRVSAVVDHDEGSAPHPLLEVHQDQKRILLVVLTSDRGLCGSFNVNITRRAQDFIRENESQYEKLEIATIGRRGRDFFRKRKVATMRDYPGVFNDLTFRRATEIAEGLCEEYTRHDLDGVYLLYNEFKSVVRQEVVIEPVLPIVAASLPVDSGSGEYIYEADEKSVLNELVPRYVAIEVWRSMLESSASEHGARMTAMDSATKAAREMMDELTLQYNRARQAAITRELLDIVGGAEALAG